MPGSVLSSMTPHASRITHELFKEASAVSPDQETLSWLFDCIFSPVVSYLALSKLNAGNSPTKYLLPLLISLLGSAFQELYQQIERDKHPFIHSVC